jgi:hypothetical protein
MAGIPVRYAGGLKLFGRTLGAAVAVVVSLAMLPSVAHAANGRADRQPAKARTTLGLRLVGLDATVAKAHGYAVVTLPDGTEASVRADLAPAARNGSYRPAHGLLGAAKSGGAISPDSFGEVIGDCGDSWVELDAIGGARATLTTGFDLVPDSGGPWDVHWHVGISDNGGHSTQNYSEENGFYGSFSWIAYARRLGLTRGPATASVTGGSFTITEAGWVCFSYSPSTTTTIW